MIQKQASALGNGLLRRNWTLMVSFSPIGGIFVNPVVKDRISSSVALRQLDSVRYWRNQSYTSPNLSSSGFGVDIKRISISAVSGRLASHKKTGCMRSQFFCNSFATFKWSNPRHKAWIACWRFKTTSFSISCWRNSDFDMVVIHLVVGHPEEFTMAIYLGSSMTSLISSWEILLSSCKWKWLTIIIMYWILGVSVTWHIVLSAKDHYYYVLILSCKTGPITLRALLAQHSEGLSN